MLNIVFIFQSENQNRNVGEINKAAPAVVDLPAWRWVQGPGAGRGVWGQSACPQVDCCLSSSSIISENVV